MQHPTSPRRVSRRVYVHAYEHLTRLCAEIQRGHYPTKAVLAQKLERTPRTIQTYLRVLQDEFDAPLAFDHVRNGFYFTDPAWRLPAIVLTEGELVSFFAAERLLRRLGATAEVQLARSALRRLAALLPQEVVVDLSALEDAMSFAPEPALDASPEILRQLAAAAMHRQTLHIHYYSQYRAESYRARCGRVAAAQRPGRMVCHLLTTTTARPSATFTPGVFTHLTETHRTFTPPADWDAQAYLQRGFGMFRGGQDVVVEVEFDAGASALCPRTHLSPHAAAPGAA